MKRYPEYKSSGIEWIGEIPVDWNTIRSRFVYGIIAGNGFSDEFQGKKEGDYPFYKCSDINSSNVFADEANNYVNRSEVMQNKWNIIPHNSILLAKIGEALKKNHRKINRYDCLIDNNMMAIAIRNTRGSIKYQYWLMSIVRMDWFTNPGAVPSVDVSKFKDFFIPNLGVKEQENIAAFLDRKTAQIDGLIAKKERMIELLKEERSAVINQAVTKGLNPKAEMKDSGIEWVGKIPRNWTTLRLKYLMNNFDGKRVPLSSEQRSELQGEYPYYGSNGIVDRVNNYLFDGEYILLGEDGAPFFEAHKDVAFLVKGKFWVNNHAHILKAIKGYEQRFLTYALNRVDYRRHITGSTRDKLTQDDMSCIDLPVMEYSEQKAIADFLESKTAQIDDQITRAQKAIELLKEYRTALISEVVTGKIDVREN